MLVRPVGPVERCPLSPQTVVPERDHRHILEQHSLDIGCQCLLDFLIVGHVELIDPAEQH